MDAPIVARGSRRDGAIAALEAAAAIVVIAMEDAHNRAGYQKGAASWQ